MNTKIETIRTRQAELASTISKHRTEAARLSDELTAIRNAIRQDDEPAKAAAQPKVDELTARIMAELDACTPLTQESEALDKQSRDIAIELKDFDLQISRANSELIPIIAQLHTLRQEVERLESLKMAGEHQIETLKAQRAQLAPANYKVF